MKSYYYPRIFLPILDIPCPDIMQPLYIAKWSIPASDIGTKAEHKQLQGKCPTPLFEFYITFQCFDDVVWWQNGIQPEEAMLKQFQKVDLRDMALPWENAETLGNYTKLKSTYEIHTRDATNTRNNRSDDWAVHLHKWQLYTKLKRRSYKGQTTNRCPSIQQATSHIIHRKTDAIATKVLKIHQRIPEKLRKQTPKMVFLRHLVMLWPWPLIF